MQFFFLFHDSIIDYCQGKKSFSQHLELLYCPPFTVKSLASQQACCSGDEFVKQYQNTRSHLADIFRTFHNFPRQYRLLLHRTQISIIYIYIFRRGKMIILLTLYPFNQILYNTYPFNMVKEARSRLLY